MPNSEAPPLSQAGTFIEKADTLFAEQDLVDAALFYWRALHALETTEKRAGSLGQRGITDKCSTPFACEPPHRRNLFSEQLAERCEGTFGARSTYSTRSSRRASLTAGKLLRDEGLDDELLAQATEEFLAVLESDPSNAEAHYLLGVLYQGNRQYKQAVEHYKQAINNDPEFQNIASEKATYLVSLLAFNYRGHTAKCSKPIDSWTRELH